MKKGVAAGLAISKVRRGEGDEGRRDTFGGREGLALKWNPWRRRRYIRGGQEDRHGSVEMNV